jgi:tetratricopeptide (TPR) repeat protein
VPGVKTKLTGLAIFSGAILFAQFARLPQAQSPEEFDAYLRVVRAPSPETIIAAGDGFCRAWPKSEFLGHVDELEFEAYRSLGDAAHAIAAAEKSLEEVPGNLEVMANLAVVLANAAAGDANRLARAQSLAQKAIAVSKSFRIPKSIAPSEWDAMCRRLTSHAHDALGLVANARGDLTNAIGEFENAIALAPAPDATQYYRLGVLYRVKGNVPGAIRNLRRAAELNEPAVRALAEEQLKLIESSLNPRQN